MTTETIIAADGEYPPSEHATDDYAPYTGPTHPPGTGVMYDPSYRIGDRIEHADLQRGDDGTGERRHFGDLGASLISRAAPVPASPLTCRTCGETVTDALAHGCPPGAGAMAFV